MDLREKEMKVKRHSQGFTLLEVLISVVILALAFATVSGLQSATITATLRMGEKQQAILVMRQLFSAIEEDLSRVSPQQLEGPPSEIYRSIFEGQKMSVQSELDQRFRVKYVAEAFNAPNIPPESLIKITITISWGASTADSLTTTYLVAKEPDV